MKMTYVAFSQSGRQTAGTVEATSLQAASESLRRQGLYVTRVVAEDAPDAAPDAGPSRARRGSQSRRLRHVAMFMRQMHALISCGTPVVQALAALERQTPAGPWRDCIADVRRRVEEGSTLSAAMDLHAEYFDNVSRSLVAAGEVSGDLSTMTDRVATITRKNLHVRTTIVGAMVYPALLMVVALSVLGVLLVVVVPKFGELFLGLDVPLPPTTQALLWLSGLVRSYWWAAIVLAVVPVVGLRMLLVSEAGRRMLDTLIIRLPQIGPVARSFITARIARLLGVLMMSHVSVLDALKLTRQSVGNRHYAALMVEAEEAVMHGNPISSAFSGTNLIAPSVCESIRSGEQSGQVGPLLVNIADFLDEENEVVLRSLTSLIEPIILVGMGILVAVVAISMFTPLFDLTSMTQQGGHP
jgi:type IV pilus assembly protein PilC